MSWDYWGGVWDDISDYVGGVVDDVADWVDDNVVEPVNDWVDDWIYDSGEQEAWAEGIVNDFVDDSVNYVVDEAAWLAEQGIYYVDEATEAVGDVVDDVSSWVNETVGGVVDEARDWVESTTQTVKDTLPVTDPEDAEWWQSILDALNNLKSPTEVITTLAQENIGNIAFEPLGMILVSLINDIGERLTRFIADALGVEIEGE